jgi:hypothetical protein
VSSIAAQASLIVAAFDLFAVTAVTGAIRAADLESGDVLTPIGIVEKPEPAPTLDSEPSVDRYDRNPPAGSRPDSMKPNCYAPCPPRHQAARQAASHVITPVCDLYPEPTCVTTNPIEPPWKVLPWMDRASQRYVLVREIKLVAAGSDISFRGKIIDVVV